MVAELISVGTELLLGNIVNTNASYLAGKCAELGLSNYYQVTVGDNVERLKETISTAIHRSDIVIITGGLGPTEDDITKEITAQVLNMPLILDERAKGRIESYFAKKYNIEMPDNNLKQAMVIKGATIVDNENGTAPGFIIKTNDDKHILLLPGPPREAIPMFEENMIPYLRSLQKEVIHSQMIKIIGYSESNVETMILDLINEQTNPTIAPYAKNGEVHIRVIAKARNKEEGCKLITPVVEEIQKRFGNNIYTTKEDETLEDVVVNLLAERNLTVATAESCTGGLIAGRIVNVSGASSVFNEGIITYSNEAKQKRIHVKEETLQKYGAVSYETAKEMACGVKEVTASDTSIAVTGIAGPLGGTDEKPVGLVYIACCVLDKIEVRKFNFQGTRQQVRESTVINALNLLRLCLLK